MRALVAARLSVGVMEAPRADDIRYGRYCLAVPVWVAPPGCGTSSALCGSLRAQRSTLADPARLIVPSLRPSRPGWCVRNDRACRRPQVAVATRRTHRLDA